MANVISETPTKVKSSGRWWFGTGIAVFLLGLAGYIVQFSVKQLVVPWYAPILATVGVLLVLVACLRRPTVVRFLGLAVLTLLCAGEWYFLVSLSRLPEYTGPAKVGQSL